LVIDTLSLPLVADDPVEQTATTLPSALTAPDVPTEKIGEEPVAPVRVKAGVVNVITLVVPLPDMATFWELVTPLLSKASIASEPAELASATELPTAGVATVTAGPATATTDGVAATGVLSPPPPQAASTAAPKAQITIFFMKYFPN
jgi:hypothetical protein